MNRSLIDVDGLDLEYRVPDRPALRALRDVHLQIQQNESIAIIGESGSGKSTLARAMLGLNPDAARISSGSIQIRACGGTVDVCSVSERDMRRIRWRHVAYVPQGALSAFNPLARVRQHFEDTSRAHDGPRGETLRTQGFELLDRVRIDPSRAWDLFPHELSGGMRQRVLIALSLLLDPAVVILDEPTTALDVLTQRSVIDVLDDLRRQTATSFVFISHDLAAAGEIADRIVCMYAGEIVENSTKRNLLTAPGHPYTDGLIKSMPSLDPGHIAVPIDGSPADLRAVDEFCTFRNRCPVATDVCSREPAPISNDGRSTRCHHPLSVGGAANGDS